MLTPDQNKESLIVDLHGDLAGILSISTQGRYDKAEQKMLFDQITELAENAEEGENPDMQDKMVAGVGFEPTTFSVKIRHSAGGSNMHINILQSTQKHAFSLFLQ